MGNKLEQLLNSLIEKGWKPTNRAKRGDVYKCEVRGLPGWINVRFFIKGEEYGNYGMGLRQLVAKDTGLWQFVCENKLIKRPKGEAPEDVRVRRYAETMGTVWNRCFGKRKPEFYIIESALKDESELESFILDSIKVEGTI